jgi:hypothetical protein
VAIAIPIALYSRNEGHADAGAALAVVAVAVPALAGYVIGRSADRKTVTVRVKD